MDNDVYSTVCCLGQLMLVGASDLIPYKTLLKISVKYPMSSCVMLSVLVNKYRASPLSGAESTHSYTPDIHKHR